MQEQTEEYIVPQIKSTKLREYLFKHPDILRALTPPKSCLNHSQIYYSGHNSFDLIQNETNLRKIRKSGSFDVIRPQITINKSDFFSNRFNSKGENQINFEKIDEFQSIRSNISPPLVQGIITKDPLLMKGNLSEKIIQNAVGSENLRKIRQKAKALDKLMVQNQIITSGIMLNETEVEKQNSEDKKAIQMVSQNKNAFFLPLSARGYSSPNNDMSSSRQLSHRIENQNVLSDHHLPEFCKPHKNSILYICTKDSCGELLCPLCLYEHQKHKHIGDYELVNEYFEVLKNKISTNYDSMLRNIERIIDLQSVLEDKNNFDLVIVEEMNRIEENIINFVKFFFKNIREEQKQEVFFEYDQIRNNLNDLHERMNSSIITLERNLQLFRGSEDVLVPYSSMSQVIQRNYLNSSQEIVKEINEISQKIKYFSDLNSSSFKGESVLQVKNNIKAHLHTLLEDEIKLTIKKTNTKNNINIAKVKILDDNNMKSIDEFNKGEQKDNNDSLFSRDPEFEIYAESPKTLQDLVLSGNENRIRAISPLQKESTLRDPHRRLNDGISNAVLEIYKTISPKLNEHEKEKELNSQSIKKLLYFMTQHYRSTKIKVFNQEFFEKLLNFTGSIDDKLIEKGKIYMEQVSQELSIDFLSKHKSVFTAYERLFFILHSQIQWILIEIRTNPKMILIYDCLGKLSKSRISEGIFSLMYEVIKYEYKNKLNQSPEGYAWEKKFVVHPTLITKSNEDSFFLAVKVISNAFQNKEFTNIRIGPNEMLMIKKKIERLLKDNEEVKSFKFIPIQVMLKFIQQSVFKFAFQQILYKVQQNYSFLFEAISQIKLNMLKFWTDSYFNLKRQYMYSIQSNV